MKNLKALLVLASAIGVAGATQEGKAQEVATEPTSKVVQASEIKWQPLNPKRGDKGPQAGTLWGDQTKPGASGFLVKFVDGFASPAHIHNITYRGVVISGGLHNDDPNATPMWMPTGSYWTQPAGEPHITSARGSSVAYVEIQEGPYLVLPTEKASDNGERPINVHLSNIVWLDASSTSWIKQPTEVVDATKGPKLAFLWGKPQKGEVSGTLLKLTAGFTGRIQNTGSTLRAVVIGGQLQYQKTDEADVKTLEPGSYFGSKGQATHQISSDDIEGSLVYVRTKGKFEVISAKR